jgi:hypothetical protein
LYTVAVVRKHDAQSDATAHWLAGSGRQRLLLLCAQRPLHDERSGPEPYSSLYAHSDAVDVAHHPQPKVLVHAEHELARGHAVLGTHDPGPYRQSASLPAPHADDACERHTQRATPQRRVMTRLQ